VKVIRCGLLPCAYGQLPGETEENHKKGNKDWLSLASSSDLGYLQYKLEFLLPHCNVSMLILLSHTVLNNLCCWYRLYEPVIIIFSNFCQ
jgi:hypothetical protein